MILTLIVLLVTVAFFIIGKIRSDIVALCSLTTLLIAGVLTPTEALSGFSSPVLIMMIGLFVISGAIFQTGVAKAISQRIMYLSKGNDTLMFLLVMLTTSLIGAFVSNTGTVALMMPIIVTMASQSGKSASRLLMPLAFASSLGAMLTLIGTPPNLIISDTLAQGGYEPLSFFSFAPVGIICIVIGIIVLLPLSKWILDKKGNGGDTQNNRKKSLDELVAEYNLKNNMKAYRISKTSEMRGKTVAELNLRNLYGLSIMEIRNEQNNKSRIMHSVKQKVASANTILHVEDILYLTGDKEGMNRFEVDYPLEKVEVSGIDFYDIGIAELVVMPNSRLIATKLKYSGLRDKYQINVLGIRRSGDYIMQNLAEEHLSAGDVLLVQGTWTNIGKLENAGNKWVVLGKPFEQQGKVILDYKAPVAVVIMVMMICAMVFDFIPIAPVTAVIAAGLLMVLCGCFHSVDAAYKTINWESIVLIAAMMPMSIALEKTGTSALVSQTLVQAIGGMGPMALLAGIYFTTSLMTMFISNTATAVLMAPIAFSAAEQLGVSPYSFLFAVTLGASMCFASPFSTPPNVLVMKAGNYNFMDYVKVGLPLQIIIGIVMTFVLPLLFPF